MKKSNQDKSRRKFIKQTTLSSTAVAVLPINELFANESENTSNFYSLTKTDSLYHGDDWESLNPGYWQVKDGSVRRKLTNVGDRGRGTGFP